MNPVTSAVVNSTKHAVMRTISVLCVLLVVAGIVLAVKRLLYPLKTFSTKMEGRRDNVNYQIEPRSYFGCQSIRVIKEKELLRQKEISPTIK